MRFAVALILTRPLHAGAEAITWDGFVQAHAAARSGGVDCPATTAACDYPAAGVRAEVKAEGKNDSGNAAFLGRGDLLRDAALDETRIVTLELYGDLIAEKSSARLGRQVITWGVGDLLFVNDTFPKDWVAFFTGQPVQYLKLGSDALKLNGYPDHWGGSANVELVIAGFRPDHLPESQRFLFADPLPVGLPRAVSEPEDLELSGRLSRYLDNWEIAAYLSRTHYRSPAWRIGASEISGIHPRLNTLGASLTGPLGKGVLSLEAGYYDSPEDRSGRDPSIENSQFRALAGYSRQLWEEATLDLQLYGEWIGDYTAYRDTLPAGFPVKERVREVATLRFTQLFAYQTVTFNLFAFLGVSENDHYVIPSLRYAFSDNLWVETGFNLFGGKRNGSFGAMGDNDNLYLTARYTF